MPAKVKKTRSRRSTYDRNREKVRLGDLVLLGELKDTHVPYIGLGHLRELSYYTIDWISPEGWVILGEKQGMLPGGTGYGIAMPQDMITKVPS